MNTGPAALDAEPKGGRTPPSWRLPCLAFLKTLGQSAKIVALYKVSHPAAVTAVGEVYKAFEATLEQTGCDRLTLTLSDEHWLANGAPLTSATQGSESLLNLFRGQGLTNLTFLRGAGLYEFSALCEVLKESPRSSDETALRDRLIQRGIRRILADTVVYSSSPEPAVPEAPSTPAPQGRVFTVLLKTLIEGAVKDPDERSHVYAEALSLIKQALDRHVATSTEALKVERERMLKEQDRAATVLSTVAAGKVIVDKEGKVLMMNTAAEQITGKRLAELAGKSIDEAVDAKEQMVAISEDLQIRDDQRLSREIRVLAEQEVGRALKQSLAVIHDESGRLVGTYSVLPEAAKFKETQKAQEDFISRVTHDLQAPLSSICCALELITEKLGPKLGPREADYMGICLKNSRRLGEMIRKILDFSKLDSGEMTVDPVAIEAQSMLSEAVDGLKPWAQRADLSLVCVPPEPRLRVMADRLRVVEILNNLVANAIKATPPGGRITVSAAAGREDARGAAVFAVKDTGHGIGPGDLERVFQKFVQLDSAGDRQGVGLGLSIVKELVRLHGGKVWVESRPGEGSTFSFSLPLARGASEI